MEDYEVLTIALGAMVTIIWFVTMLAFHEIIRIMQAGALMLFWLRQLRHLVQEDDEDEEEAT